MSNMDIYSSGKSFLKRIPVWAFLAALFAMGILLKLLILRHTPFVSRDSFFYLRQIKDLYEMGVHDYYRNSPESNYPPMLFFLTLGFIHLGMDELHAGLTVNILLGSLFPVAGYFLAVEATGRKSIGMLGAVFLMLHPRLNELSVQVQRDIGYLFFSALVMWMMICGVKRKKEWYWIGSGVFLSYAILFRTEALEFLPIALIVVLVMLLKKEIKLKQASCCFACFVLSLMLSFTVFTMSAGLKYRDVENIYGWSLKRINIPAVMENP